MENSKPINALKGFHDEINKIIQSLSLKSLQLFISTQSQNFDEVIKSCDNTFLDCAQKKIILAKKKILEDILNVYPLLREEQVKVVKDKIKELILPTENILRDGILGIYSEISELQEKKSQKLQMSQLLEKIQRSLEPLLRDHFILKQIERMDTKYNSNSLKLILSQKKINISEDSLSSFNSQHSINQFLSERALKIIEKQIQCKSIQLLINEQLIGEEKEISQGLQTCRICKNSFKLRHIERHVDYCSKIQSYSARRQEILNQQLEIIDEMRNQITNQAEIIDEEESFKIFKLIVDSFQKRPNLFRRISAHHHKQRKLSKKISEQIEGYLKQHNNEYIQTFKELGRERQLIEKKITSLENNFLYHRKQQEQSQNNSVSICSSKKISRSNKTAKLMNLHTKKSIFARKSESSQADQDEINDQLTKVGNSNEMNSVSGEIQKYQKRQILYKSLSDIKFNDDINKSQVSVKDFEILSFLGKGAFGKVYLVRRKQTKDIYALKVIKILPSWGEKQLNSIKNEHEILSRIAGEHLVKATFSFTEGFAHFFVFQYMPGGDLGKLLEEQVYLDMKQSQFYLAEIVLAIEHLHSMGIIHRDLKPENIIFDQNCHLKLTDFGLSEFRINDKLKRARKLKRSVQEQMDRISLPQDKQNSKQRSFLNENKTKIKIVGTPDYIAPQVINGQSLDNLSIDWWSLGVIAYEMIIGCRPFCANTVEQVFKNIQQVNIQWPQIGDQEDMVSPIAVDLINKLLNKNFNERLGAKSISQIKQHPFFEGINWQQIKQEKPPLIPKLNPKQKYQYSEQKAELRAQIKNEIGNDTKVKSSFKLQNFVRYDILVEETLESADKQIVKRAVRINRLKSIASNFSNQSIENKPGTIDSGEALSDEEIGKSWRTIQKIRQ